MHGPVVLDSLVSLEPFSTCFSVSQPVLLQTTLLSHGILHLLIPLFLHLLIIRLFLHPSFLPPPPSFIACVAMHLVVSRAGSFSPANPSYLNELKEINR